MATKPAAFNEVLTGLDAELASAGLAQSPRGGVETGFDGTSGGAVVPVQQQPEEQAPADGPLLTGNDPEVFRLIDQLAKRQDLLVASHIALDTHWTVTKLGYGLYSNLKKEPGKDIYTHSMTYGARAIGMNAVPNKVWKCVNQTVEALMVDFPEGDCEPDNPSEEAKKACDVGNRFLTEDGSEQGTNDFALFHDRVTRAMTCATAYLECWSDPTGGGYVPLQIKAHPQAMDASNPLVGPDGQPTTDHILRYVTPTGQFTENPAEAAPQWQPKLRAAKWGREHVRVYPEHARVEDAEMVIIVGYCTISEAKRRWKAVAQMQAQQLETLCGWTPDNYMTLLPPNQRARWKQSDGRDKDKKSASDERLMFYYHAYVRACPDYKKGADVVVSGANAGIILGKDFLSAEVDVKEEASTVQQAPSALQAAPDGALAAGIMPKPKKQIRCMEIPVVQVTPRRDPDELDPTGRAYVEMIAGACESNAYLAMAFKEAIEKTLTQPFAIQSTSPIEGWQVEDARATGDFLILDGPEDEPKQLQPPVLPNSFFNMFELTDEAINSIASTERASSGSSQAQERSGKAIQLAVSQNNVSLSGMNTEINNAFVRWQRIKIQMATKHFTTAQVISYIGEDGAYKQDDFTGLDAAQIGNVTIKGGTGTLMPADQKVQYLANLQGAGLLPAEEAMEAARPAYAKRLGLPDSPHEQYVERCVDAWLKGPPTPDWEQQFAAGQQAMAQWKQKVSALVQQQLSAGVTPDPTTPPPEAGPAPTMPFNPFAPRPNDDEPGVAAIWVRKLSRVISSNKWSDATPGWRQILSEKYLTARKFLAPPPMPGGPAQPGQPKQPSDGTPPKAPGQQSPGAQPTSSPLAA